MPFQNQILAAANIHAIFRDNTRRYALLMAQCQAGKTGAFQELIRLMLADGLVSRAYILCGSNETELRNQAHEDTKAANPQAYDSGIIQVIFRQDFNDATMDIANALVVVDESHMDQNQKQELDRFLGRHGLTMDGNPRTLIAKNAFIVSVDATPYSELASLQHKESFEKHVEVLAPGDNYFGLPDFFYGGLITPTFDIESNRAEFASLVTNGGAKYSLIRFTTGKDAEKQEAAAVAVFRSLRGKVCYYTAERTEIAITAAQKAALNLPLCLEDAPTVPTLVIIRGRLRAGKVVPKKHIAFVWEGAKISKTDSLVQGLPGRMCGYEFGATKPLIFLPSSSLKRDENKVIKSSEIERAMMSFPVALPRMGTNLKKNHVAAATSNGKTQCPPFRMTWEAGDNVFALITDQFNEENTHGDSRATIQEACYNLLLKKLDEIASSPNYSSEQKREILEQIIPAGAAATRIRNMHGASQIPYFTSLHEGYQNGTAASIGISQEEPLYFVITYRGYQAPHANHRHIYVVFYTDATSGAAPGIMSVDIKSRIPQTNGRSVFSIHESQIDVPLVAGGVIGFDESKLSTPTSMEAVLREYLHREREPGLLTMSRCIKSNKDRFKLSKRGFNYVSTKQNEVENICARLSREFAVQMKVGYTRGGNSHFNIKKIEW